MCEFLACFKSQYLFGSLEASSTDFYNVQIKLVLRGSLAEVLTVYVPPDLMRHACVCAAKAENLGSLLTCRLKGFVKKLYSQSLTFHILSLPLPSPQLQGGNNQGWALALWVEYRLWLGSCFEEMRLPLQAQCSGLKQAMKGTLPFLSNWLLFLRSIMLECSLETPIFL